MNKQDIKSRAWEEIEKYINLNDEEFNNCAYSFKISDNYNLVVWCDIDKEEENIERYFIVSIRYNPYDKLFGDDIGAEYCTNNISQFELDKAIDYVLSYKDLQ